MVAARDQLGSPEDVIMSSLPMSQTVSRGYSLWRAFLNHGPAAEELEGFALGASFDQLSKLTVRRWWDGFGTNRIK